MFSPFDSGLPTVALARQSLDELRVLGSIAQRDPQAVYGRIDTVLELHHGVIRPEFLLQVFPSDQFPRTLQQRDQNLQGLFGKTQRRTTVLVQFAGANIQRKVGKERQLFGLVRTWQDGLLIANSSTISAVALYRPLITQTAACT